MAPIPELIGKQARVTTTVTAIQPTREWTGTRVWEGRITDGRQVDGSLRGVCVLTDRTYLLAGEQRDNLRNEHTWLALGERDDTIRDGKPSRHWSTVIEFLG